MTFKEEFYSYTKSLGLKINDAQRLMYLAKLSIEEENKAIIMNYSQEVIKEAEELIEKHKPYSKYELSFDNPIVNSSVNSIKSAIVSVECVLKSRPTCPQEIDNTLIIKNPGYWFHVRLKENFNYWNDVKQYLEDRLKEYE